MGQEMGELGQEMGEVGPAIPCLGGAILEHLAACPDSRDNQKEKKVKMPLTFISLGLFTQI